MDALSPEKSSLTNGDVESLWIHIFLITFGGTCGRHMDPYLLFLQISEKWIHMDEKKDLFFEQM